MLKVKKRLKKKEPFRAVPEGGVPAVRASICTGEKVAGFRFDDGRFEEICLINDDAALAAFAGEYGIDPKTIKTFY